MYVAFLSKNFLFLARKYNTNMERKAFSLIAEAVKNFLEWKMWKCDNVFLKTCASEAHFFLLNDVRQN